MMEKATFTTYDEVKIVGSWNPVPTTLGVCVLLHMMPLDKSSWVPFMQVLAKKNIASLAIDMRGHGESDTTLAGGKLDYKSFTDDQHQQYLIDADEATRWLKQKGYALDRVMFAGASIGANIAVQMLQEEPGLAGAAVLSPGNYRGIDVVSLAGYVRPHHALWAAASDSDDTESFDAAKKLIEKADCDRKYFQPYKNAGHGTHLFTSDPELMDNLANWIYESLTKA